MPAEKGVVDQTLPMKQLSFFPDPPDPRSPETVTWNLWHGCTKISTGCSECYMYRRDEKVGKDPAIVRKTKAFDLPVRTLRAGKHRGLYKIPSGSHIFTCFSSDFFHKDADRWRDEAWEMIQERSDCTFFMITKRPERIKDHIPTEAYEWDHLTIAVTCENQRMAQRRLPVYLPLPLRHHSVMIEPMLSAVNLKPFFLDYPNVIESVSVGGESGPNARACDYSWVMGVHLQCVENGVAFSYHQTGARLIKGGKEYSIPRELQHEQAHRAKLDYDPEAGLRSFLDMPGE